MNTYSIFSKLSNAEFRKNIANKMVSDYAKRSPQIYLEYCASDCGFGPDQHNAGDQDGDSFRARVTLELMETTQLRVLIPEYSDPTDVIRQLEKIVGFLKKDPDHFRHLRVDYDRYDVRGHFAEDHDCDDIPF